MIRFCIILNIEKWEIYFCILDAYNTMQGNVTWDIRTCMYRYPYKNTQDCVFS